MKKLLLLLLLLMSMMTMGKEPYYIVNGEPGIAKKDLPPDDQIGSRKVISPEEAVYIYGEQASGGAVYIKTKDVLQREVKREEAELPENAERLATETEPAQTEETQDQPQEEVIGNDKFLMYFQLLFVLFSFIVFIIIFVKAVIKVIAKTGQIYDPGPFDPDGVRFKVSELFVFRLMIVYLVVGLIGPLYLMVVLRFNISIRVILIAMLIFFVYFCYLRLLNGKSYLVIDKQGIRGLVAEYSGVLAKPEFVEINIAWKQVESAKFFQQQSGSINLKCLAFYDATNPEVPFITVNIPFFPTSKVIDCINYFYSGYAHKSVSDNPLIAPL